MRSPNSVIQSLSGEETTGQENYSHKRRSSRSGHMEYLGFLQLRKISEAFFTKSFIDSTKVISFTLANIKRPIPQNPVFYS